MKPRKKSETNILAEWFGSLKSPTLDYGSPQFRRLLGESKRILVNHELASAIETLMVMAEDKEIKTLWAIDWDRDGETWYEYVKNYAPPVYETLETQWWKQRKEQANAIIRQETNRSTGGDMPSDSDRLEVPVGEALDLERVD